MCSCASPVFFICVSVVIGCRLFLYRMSVVAFLLGIGCLMNFEVNVVLTYVPFVEGGAASVRNQMSAFVSRNKRNDGWLVREVSCMLTLSVPMRRVV